MKGEESMKKVLVISLVFALVASSMLWAGGEAEKATDSGVIELKLGLNDPNTSNYYKGAMAIAENVAKETNGRIKITVFPSGGLGNEREMVEGAMMNTVDIWTSANSVLTNFIPQMGLLDVAYLWDNAEQAHAAVDGELGDIISQEIDKQLGLKVIGWMESGFRDTFSTRPVKTLADFRGLKIRTMENQYHMAAFNSFGAIATPMAYGDVFPALQQNTIDAAENAVANCLASGYYEVTKHITDTHHAFVYILVGMSPKAWEKIPEDLREPFLRGVENGCNQQRQFLVEANEEATVELKKLGVQFYNIDRTQLQSAYAADKAKALASFDPNWVALAQKAIEQHK
jgi:tripartite ATP-independent transporter DctP family solute receptor